jgi:basic membrane protein A
MKKFGNLMTIILALAFFLGACGAPATTPEPVTPPEVQPTQPEITEEPPSPPQQAFRVAVVMPSATTDLAFSQSMYDALLRVQEEMGGPTAFEFVYSEGMFVVDDAAAAIRDYASQGYNLVIAHGSQYGSSLQEIAPDFPNVSFAWGTTVDTFGQPNIFAYEAASQEGGYALGFLAGFLTKSKVIGIVGPIETGDAKLYVDGFKAGVEKFSANTNTPIEVNVNYIGSFSDVALAAEAATTHIAAGADILTGTAQMVVGAIGKAEEANALWFGTQSNQRSLAPKIVVASQVYHWEVVLKEMITLIQGGTLGGKSFTANLANGGEVIEFNPDWGGNEAEAMFIAGDVIKGIEDGTIKITLP